MIDRINIYIDNLDAFPSNSVLHDGYVILILKNLNINNLTLWEKLSELDARCLLVGMKRLWRRVELCMLINIVKRFSLKATRLYYKILDRAFKRI